MSRSAQVCESPFAPEIGARRNSASSAKIVKVPNDIGDAGPASLRASLTLLALSVGVNVPDVAQMTPTVIVTPLAAAEETGANVQPVAVPVYSKSFESSPVKALLALKRKTIDFLVEVKPVAFNTVMVPVL